MDEDAADEEDAPFPADELDAIPLDPDGVTDPLADEGAPESLHGTSRSDCH
ncbi:MAG TPA: hypothetical protein VE093_10660 [Polyangiaceae bacterium]|nr:hypothetical protein [Polyangiaceae bacterium]